MEIFMATELVIGEAVVTLEALEVRGLLVVLLDIGD